MIPYRLHYIADVPGWAYWWVGLALQRYAPEHVTVTMGCHNRNRQQAVTEAVGADIVFNMVYQDTPEFALSLRQQSPGTLLATGFNVGWERNAAHYLPIIAQHSTHAIVNNRDCWAEGIRRGLITPERSSFVSIGVDCGLFREIVPYEKRKPRVLMCCSTGHASWKGADILRGMIPQFEAAGFETDIVVKDSLGNDRMNQEQLVDYYNTGTVYVCASEPRNEGTPMPPLEAAACGCVVVSTYTGSMPEVIAGRWNGIMLPDREPETILEAVQYARENADILRANMRKTLIAEWDWPERAKRYFEVFDKLIQRRELPGEGDA